MNPFDAFLAGMIEFIGMRLYEGVFLAALLETIVPPIPTLAIFPTAGFVAKQQGLSVIQVIPMIILGGLGATIGSTVIYLVALKLGRVVLLRYLKYFRISESKLERVEKWFAKYGDKSVLLGRMIPVMREMISVPAGLLRMNTAKFVMYTFVGSCAWAALTILAGYHLDVVCEIEWDYLQEMCSIGIPGSDK